MLFIFLKWWLLVDSLMNLVIYFINKEACILFSYKLATNICQTLDLNIFDFQVIRVFLFRHLQHYSEKGSVGVTRLWRLPCVKQTLQPLDFLLQCLHQEVAPGRPRSVPLTCSLLPSTLGCRLCGLRSSPATLLYWMCVPTNPWVLWVLLPHLRLSRRIVAELAKLIYLMCLGLCLASCAIYVDSSDYYL